MVDAIFVAWVMGLIIAALCSELRSASRHADGAQRDIVLLLARLQESEAERIRLLNKLAGGEDVD